MNTEKTHLIKATSSGRRLTPENICKDGTLISSGNWFLSWIFLGKYEFWHEFQELTSNAYDGFCRQC